ncbi:uncharacterized protein BO96DRAFT_469973 [Aspergillus niger CBS 101883]|uniref:Uncharacterized protein n=2 Tax=Aspergillus niger TaxID=5061 RepID=A2QY12_ASPNC|nr:uncharacterized protein BO96DRAFT_469973 [Aspergillus niger CBS 101883]XP_059601703.1 hypothetical protein An11g10940 [Aspergillus niger]PYH51627.1 hypothetical protein BO96DRAFT_469973 [Aspergillus niger CBS 101883]CAK40892.1 hypothetical protein An11g10940 [Aspergillus niger]
MSGEKGGALGILVAKSLGTVGHGRSQPAGPDLGLTEVEQTVFKAQSRVSIDQTDVLMGGLLQPFLGSKTHRKGTVQCEAGTDRPGLADEMRPGTAAEVGSPEKEGWTICHRPPSELVPVAFTSCGSRVRRDSQESVLRGMHPSSCRFNLPACEFGLPFSPPNPHQTIYVFILSVQYVDADSLHGSIGEGPAIIPSPSQLTAIKWSQLLRTSSVPTGSIFRDPSQSSIAPKVGQRPNLSVCWRWIKLDQGWLLRSGQLGGFCINFHHASFFFPRCRRFTHTADCIYSLHIQSHTYRMVVMPTFRVSELGHSVARMQSSQCDTSPFPGGSSAARHLIHRRSGTIIYGDGMALMFHQPASQQID